LSNKHIPLNDIENTKTGKQKDYFLHTEKYQEQNDC